jgi:hypothetical protein
MLPSVERREYRIQRIDGLSPKKVTPDPAVLGRIREEAPGFARQGSVSIRERIFWKVLSGPPVVGSAASMAASGC